MNHRKKLTSKFKISSLKMSYLEGKNAEMYDYIAKDAIGDAKDFLRGLKELNYLEGGDHTELEEMIKDVKDMKNYLKALRRKNVKEVLKDSKELMEGLIGLNEENSDEALEDMIGDVNDIRNYLKSINNT